MKLLRLRRGNFNAGGRSDSSGLPETEESHVILIEDEKDKKKQNSKIGNQGKINILLLILLGLGLLLVKRLDSRLPEPVKDYESLGATLKFSEERARTNLEELTSVGVRVSGSEATDITTVNNLVAVLTDIQNSVRNPNLTLDFDVQRPSGSFSITDHDGGHTSVYRGIANVVAKLEAREPSARSSSSILMNCHFDSKPGSPGATDNMISCVTMLEVIRVLYRVSAEQNLEFPNSVVFLFNGAEELGLQGAHGFVKGDGNVGHPWAENLTCFINLEGAGGGGREILFQSGPGNAWILSAYAKSAPHPYGLVLAEEAFQMGLIPSDTDFRIFRDFRDIPGLDMAFVKNGWVYHTKWDRVTEIPPGSIQNMGDNALALVQYLAKLDFGSVKREKEGSNMVFFDVLGLFMVSYSESTGIIVNFFFATVFVIITAIEVNPSKRSGLITFVLLPVSTVLAWGAAVGVGAFMGAFLNWAGYYKPFFSYPFMTVILFGVPAILAQSLVYSIVWKGSQEKSWLAGKFTLALVLFSISYPTRSSYIVSLILFFAILAWIPHRFIFQKKKKSFRALEAASTIILGELAPFLFTSYMTVTLIDVFVPIQGRAGTESDPNVFLGLVIAAITSVLTFNGLSSFLVSWNRMHLVAALLLSLFVINPLIAVGFIGRIPYQEKTPMRVRVLDTDRTWYNSNMTENKTDAGYWFWPVDPDTFEFLPEFSKTIPSIRNIVELEANSDHCEDLYCNQPFLWPTGNSIKKTPWVPKSFGLPYTVKDQVQLRVTRNELMSPTLRNVTLAFEGPTEMSIAFSPSSKLKLQSWNLESPVTGYNLWYKGRGGYFLYVGKGFGVESFELSLIFELTANEEEDNLVMDLMVVGHFMHDVYEWNFKEFVQKFPAWTNVMHWTAVLKQFQLVV